MPLTRCQRCGEAGTSWVEAVLSIRVTAIITADISHVVLRLGANAQGVSCLLSCHSFVLQLRLKWVYAL